MEGLLAEFGKVGLSEPRTPSGSTGRRLAALQSRIGLQRGTLAVHAVGRANSYRTSLTPSELPVQDHAVDQLCYSAMSWITHSRERWWAVNFFGDHAGQRELQ